MTGRDRIVMIVLAALAILAVAWMLVVSPERKKANEVKAKVAAASSELTVARTKLSEAVADEKRYAAAYTSIVSLGQAVPAESEVSSLVYELDHASAHDRVNFEAITSGGSGSSGSSSSTAASALTSTGGFQQMPFDFTFTGTYKQLYELIGRLQGFTVSNPDGSVKVNGRLLSINGLKLVSGSLSKSGREAELKAEVSATAYILPAGQSLASGASAGAPAGASPASTGGAGGSTATPAIVRPLP